MKHKLTCFPQISQGHHPTLQHHLLAEPGDAVLDQRHSHLYIVNSKHLTFCLQFDFNITLSELNHLILKTCGNGIRSPGPTTSPAYRYLEVVCPVDVKGFQHVFLNKTIKTRGYVNNPLIIQFSRCHFCQVKENIQFHFRSPSSLPKNVLLSTS